MPKPIVFIQLPSMPAEMDFIEQQASIESVQKAIEDIKNEYFVLIADSGAGDNTLIQVFFEKDFNEVKYDELKSIIENAVKK